MMYSKFRKKKGKSNTSRPGFDFFNWLEKWVMHWRVTNRKVANRCKQEKLAAKDFMMQAAADKRLRRGIRNHELLAFSPNYGKHRHAQTIKRASS